MNLQLGWDGLPTIVRGADATGTVHVEDLVSIGVKLLPILDLPSMRAVLRETLRAAGWTEEPDGALSKPFGEVVARLLPDASAVEVRATVRAEITARAEVTVAQGDDAAEAEARAREEAEKKVEARRASAEEAARRETLARLAAEERAVREDLQRALNKTYRRALEERARAMGEVESVRESGDPSGSYEVTVVVRA